MRAILTEYVATLVIFLALDAVWLGVVALPMFKAQLGDQLLIPPNWVAAVAFYLIYVAGMVFFAVDPAVRGGGWLGALGTGAVLGLCAYATYDLTNMTTLKVWSWGVALPDTAWGMVATGVASALATIATRALLPAS